MDDQLVQRNVQQSQSRAETRKQGSTFVGAGAAEPVFNHGSCVRLSTMSLHRFGLKFTSPSKRRRSAESAMSWSEMSCIRQKRIHKLKMQQGPEDQGEREREDRKTEEPSTTALAKDRERERERERQRERERGRASTWGLAAKPCERKTERARRPDTLRKKVNNRCAIDCEGCPDGRS